MTQSRRAVVIQGRVQGVGFRISCQREALARGLTGWVRNRSDGAVEALFEGATSDVEALLAWCQHGPPAAHVTDVEMITPPTETCERSFRVRG